MADPSDTELMRTIAIVWRSNGAGATADAIGDLCDEVDSLRAENALLRGDNATLGSTVTELRDQLREAQGEPT